MPSFKPVYLMHGDDHGRIAERRARLRSLAEKASGAQGLEIFEGDRATPQEVAASLSMMTFALGRRFLIVDGVERWKDKDLEPLEAALAGIGPDTTIALFAREDGRAKASPRLHDAVRAAGGGRRARARRAAGPGQAPAPHALTGRRRVDRRRAATGRGAPALRH